MLFLTAVMIKTAG